MTRAVTCAVPGVTCVTRRVPGGTDGRLVSVGAGQLAAGPGGAGLLRADAGDVMRLAAGDVWDVRLERLAIMGGWDCGFDAVHAR